MTWKPVVRQPLPLYPRQVRGADRAAERVRTPETRVVDQHDQHVGRPLRRLGAGHDRPVAHGLIQRAPHRAAEVAVRQRQPGAVGIKFAHRLGQRRLHSPQRRMLQLHNRFHRRPCQRLLDRKPALGRQHRDDHPGTGGQRLPDLVVQTALESVIGECAGQRARGRADRHRGQQRRREQTHRDTNTRPPASALAAQVVARVDHRGFTLGVLRHEHRPPKRDVLGLDPFGQRIEVPASRIEVRIGRHQHQRIVFTHRGSPFRCRGLTEQNLCRSLSPVSTRHIEPKVPSLRTDSPAASRRPNGGPGWRPPHS